MLESRQDFLCKINEVSFAVNDLTLYLDTHPTDTDALNLFEEYKNERKNLMDQYAGLHEPLTVNCVNVNQPHNSSENCQYPNEPHFTWVDGPLPWEGGLA